VNDICPTAALARRTYLQTVRGHYKNNFSYSERVGLETCKSVIVSRLIVFYVSKCFLIYAMYMRVKGNRTGRFLSSAMYRRVVEWKLTGILKKHLPLQGRRANHVRIHHEAASKQSGLAYSSKWHVSPKRRLALTGLHGVISQKIGVLVTAVTTSNPTRNERAAG
jgi:hypothetical protein